jgi:phage FluMu protein Com
MPSVASLQYAANGVTDNLVVHIECGKCKHQWQDGVRFKDVVVVRCPGCKALNKVDTSPHIGEIAGMLQFNVSMG